MPTQHDPVQYVVNSQPALVFVSQQSLRRWILHLLKAAGQRLSQVNNDQDAAA